MKKILAAISLMLGFAMPSLADDRDQLLGLWKLQTYELEFEDTGERKMPFGAHPNGYGVFTPEGRTIAILTAEGRTAPKTEADRAEAFRTMVSYTGTYRVEGDHWITKVDTSWNEAWIGTEQVRYFKVEGDTLTITSAWAASLSFDGRIVRGHLTWTREK